MIVRGTKPLVERISYQTENLIWLLDILLNNGMAEEFVELWAKQGNLVRMHEQASPMVRYELSRISAGVFIALGKRKVQCCGDIRSLLFYGWFSKMLWDFGWLQRCPKGLDVRSLEENLGRGLLTLPLKQQQGFFEEWFQFYASRGGECPNLIRAFQRLEVDAPLGPLGIATRPHQSESGAGLPTYLGRAPHPTPTTEAAVVPGDASEQWVARDGRSFFLVTSGDCSFLLSCSTAAKSSWCPAGQALLPAHKVASEPPDVVPPACMAAHATGKNLTTVDFCLSVLEHHSVGAADFNDLALFAVNITTANATATKTKLDGMFTGSGVIGNDTLLEGLRLCRDQYDKVLRVYQPYCYAAVSDRKFGDARSCLGRTVEGAGVCEQWFRQRNLTSPVAKEDDNLVKLANLAVALTMVSYPVS
ncbi:hypothetical protein PR202_ga30456 [Eleusine coracana subsp. coracana]|uniref:Pectinesterase inhibitor domain-containing protein n=1 Tax=Eleusine coracana subsp. coracana TaxID=191504 RepID=A0AAV5DPB5_ELECO|nr:hypothetical protein PR202_ga30456 [Eleusine coracana subsp. coracana]